MNDVIAPVVVQRARTKPTMTITRLPLLFSFIRRRLSSMQLRRLGGDDGAELVDQRRDRVRAREEREETDRDEEHRRDGEERVVGERRGEIRDAVRKRLLAGPDDDRLVVPGDAEVGRSPGSCRLPGFAAVSGCGRSALPCVSMGFPYPGGIVFPRGRGGTGRRGGFRTRWASALGGSSPLARTYKEDARPVPRLW